MDTVLQIKPSPEFVAEEFVQFLLASVKEQDITHIALSGGSTPALLFDLIAKEYKDEFDWNKIHFYWGDERCVPPNHQESNYKMTNDLLLRPVNIPKSNVHRILGENKPELEVLRYSEEINSNLPLIAGIPIFDIILLGMGTDGHTASIFPHQLELLNSKNTCSVATHPETGQNRITLTGTIINSAAKICFFVTGESKKEKLSEIIKHEGSWQNYPASFIKPVNGILYWFLDAEAAADL